MLRVALRPKSLGLLALMLIATLLCGLLATWQWDRAHRFMEAGKARAVTQAVPLGDLLKPGEPVTNQAAGRLATVTGRYDPSEQVLIPGRSVDGRDAVIVVTALHVRGADGADIRLPVARGWIEADEVRARSGSGANGSGIDPAAVPAPPAGDVAVTGRIEASEQATRGIVDGTANEISTSLLVNEWGQPMYSGFLAVSTSSGGLHAMPEASSDFSRGLNWQNLGYAAQWIAFGVFFLYLWFRTVRTDYLDERAEQEERVRARLGAAQASREDNGSGGSAPPASNDSQEDHRGKPATDR